MLLAPGRQRLRLLLDTIQCTGQPHTTKNYLAPNINSVETEHPGEQKQNKTKQKTKYIVTKKGLQRKKSRVLKLYLVGYAE